MNFNEAILELQKGKKVRRKTWESFNGYLFIAKQTLMYTDNETTHQYSLTWQKIMATDWEVYEDITQEMIDNFVKKIFDKMAFDIFMENLKKISEGRFKTYDLGKKEAREEEFKFLINLLVEYTKIGMSSYECDELCKYKYKCMELVDKRIEFLKGGKRQDDRKNKSNH